jgi:hypothetical protein
MKRIVVLVLAVASGVVAATATAFAVGGAEQADVGGISNAGVPVDVAQLSPHAIEGLQRAGGTGTLNRLGERAGTTFFAGSSFAEGRFCFATADAGGRGPVTCQGAEGVFPSADAPLADFSPRRGNDPVNPADEVVQILRLVGFAADGVEQVGVVAVDGSVFTTPVVNNIYASNDVPATPARAIVALDSDGKTIHTVDLVSS